MNEDNIIINKKKKKATITSTMTTTTINTSQVKNKKIDKMIDTRKAPHYQWITHNEVPKHFKRFDDGEVSHRFYMFCDVPEIDLGSRVPPSSSSSSSSSSGVDNQAKTKTQAKPKPKPKPPVKNIIPRYAAIREVDIQHLKSYDSEHGQGKVGKGRSVLDNINTILLRGDQRFGYQHFRFLRQIQHHLIVKPHIAGSSTTSTHKRHIIHIFIRVETMPLPFTQQHPNHLLYPFVPILRDLINDETFAHQMLVTTAKTSKDNSTQYSDEYMTDTRLMWVFSVPFYYTRDQFPMLNSRNVTDIRPIPPILPSRTRFTKKIMDAIDHENAQQRQWDAAPEGEITQIQKQSKYWNPIERLTDHGSIRLWHRDTQPMVILPMKHHRSCYIVANTHDVHKITIPHYLAGFLLWCALTNEWDIYASALELYLLQFHDLHHHEANLWSKQLPLNLALNRGIAQLKEQQDKEMEQLEKLPSQSQLRSAATITDATITRYIKEQEVHMEKELAPLREIVKKVKKTLIGFQKPLEILLVEASPVLQTQQGNTAWLAHYGRASSYMIILQMIQEYRMKHARRNVVINDGHTMVIYDSFVGHAFSTHVEQITMSLLLDDSRLTIDVIQSLLTQSNKNFTQSGKDQSNRTQSNASYNEQLYELKHLFNSAPKKSEARRKYGEQLKVLELEKDVWRPTEDDAHLDVWASHDKHRQTLAVSTYKENLSDLSHRHVQLKTLLGELHLLKTERDAIDPPPSNDLISTHRADRRAKHENKKQTKNNNILELHKSGRVKRKVHVNHDKTDPKAFAQNIKAWLSMDDDIYALEKYIILLSTVATKSSQIMQAQESKFIQQFPSLNDLKDTNEFIEWRSRIMLHVQALKQESPSWTQVTGRYFMRRNNPLEVQRRGGSGGTTGAGRVDNEQDEDEMIWEYRDAWNPLLSIDSLNTFMEQQPLVALTLLRHYKEIQALEAHREELYSYDELNRLILNKSHYKIYIGWNFYRLLHIHDCVNGHGSHDLACESYIYISPNEGQNLKGHGYDSRRAVLIPQGNDIMVDAWLLHDAKLLQRVENAMEEYFNAQYHQPMVVTQLIDGVDLEQKDSVILNQAQQTIVGANQFPIMYHLNGKVAIQNQIGLNTTYQSSLEHAIVISSQEFYGAYRTNQQVTYFLSYIEKHNAHGKYRSRRQVHDITKYCRVPLHIIQEFYQDNIQLYRNETSFEIRWFRSIENKDQVPSGAQQVQDNSILVIQTMKNHGRLMRQKYKLRNSILEIKDLLNITFVPPTQTTIDPSILRQQVGTLLGLKEFTKAAATAASPLSPPALPNYETIIMNRIRTHTRDGFYRVSFRYMIHPHTKDVYDVILDQTSQNLLPLDKRDGYLDKAMKDIKRYTEKSQGLHTDTFPLFLIANIQNQLMLLKVQTQRMALFVTNILEDGNVRGVVIQTEHDILTQKINKYQMFQNKLWGLLPYHWDSCHVDFDFTSTTTTTMTTMTTTTTTMTMTTTTVPEVKTIKRKTIDPNEKARKASKAETLPVVIVVQDSERLVDNNSLASAIRQQGQSILKYDLIFGYINYSDLSFYFKLGNQALGLLPCYGKILFEDLKAISPITFSSRLSIAYQDYEEVYVYHFRSWLLDWHLVPYRENETLQSAVTLIDDDNTNDTNNNAVAPVVDQRRSNLWTPQPVVDLQGKDPNDDFIEIYAISSQPFSSTMKRTRCEHYMSQNSRIQFWVCSEKRADGKTSIPGKLSSPKRDDDVSFEHYMNHQEQYRLIATYLPGKFREAYPEFIDAFPKK